METMTLPVSILTKRQVKTYGPRIYTEHGFTYRITVKVRYDDQCNNGHNTFAITCDIEEKSGGIWRGSGGGAAHDTIVKYFPELASYIKWHLCSSDGPLHYIANTVFFAGDRDCHGLRKGEEKQIRNGRTKELSWILEGIRTQYKDGEKPAETYTIGWKPWMKIGEGKERELDQARHAAIWPDATDAELMAEKEVLTAKLQERLPVLMSEFKAAVESLGFTY